MTLGLEVRQGGLWIIDGEGELSAETKSALRLKGFRRESDCFIADMGEKEELGAWTTEFLDKLNLQYEVDEHVAKILERRKDAKSILEESRKIGERIKTGDIADRTIGEFRKFLQNGLKRCLLEHQIKAAIHLVCLAHAANFSVPGAGKTSVVLAVYEFLRKKGKLNSLFVVGPRSCFQPWQSEFELTLGRQTKVEVLAAGNPSERHQRYYPQSGDEAELYLTTYHTLARDKEQVQHLLQSNGVDAFFVIDEGHYMKQDEGVWANAVAETSKEAKKRCILTGTPFPKSYADGLNLFEVLYPNSDLFSSQIKARIRHVSESGQHQAARSLLEPAIDSLYYRVRKTELNLSKPVFLEPILVDMNPIERDLYNCIEKRIGELEEGASDRDLDTIIRLRRGRQIRRRQATSYAALLLSGIDGYDEELITPKDEDLNAKIRNYSQIETPAKMVRLMQEVEKLLQQDEKVVIWASFVGTLHRIHQECKALTLDSKVVFGGTPTDEDKEDENREFIIETFKMPDSGLNILIANPAACAESISLHKTCSNAIYYDLSYNCAEYLQSLDRIHRVGGSETKVSYYRYLQYADTFEHKILANLTEKSNRMADIIDQDFPLALCELEDLGLDEDEGIV